MFASEKKEKEMEHRIGVRTSVLQLYFYSVYFKKERFFCEGTNVLVTLSFDVFLRLKKY